MRRQIPNALSLLRILLGPCIVFVSPHLSTRTYWTTLCILALALLSDALDGYLARLWKITSKLGYILDSVGDRAVHLALILVFWERYQIPLVFIWLLVFRDIAIFAMRALNSDWLNTAIRLQWISRAYAIMLRLWLGLFVFRDGYQVFMHVDRLDTFTFAVAQNTIVGFTILIAYFSLFRTLNIKTADIILQKVD